MTLPRALCPRCFGDLPLDAAGCPHCGGDASPGATLAESPRGRAATGEAGAAALALAIAGLLGCNALCLLPGLAALHLVSRERASAAAAGLEVSPATAAAFWIALGSSALWLGLGLAVGCAVAT